MSKFLKFFYFFFALYILANAVALVVAYSERDKYDSVFVIVEE